MTRVIAFNVAKFGNSDPKKFPGSMQRFWPLPWDKKPESRISQIQEEYEKKVALRERLRSKSSV